MIRNHLSFIYSMRSFNISTIFIAISIVGSIYINSANADTHEDSVTSADHLCELLTECKDNTKIDISDNQTASYALGVKFQRDVVKNFNDMEYAYFIRGIRDAEIGKVIQDSSELDKSLENVIINKSDKSKRFLKEFIASNEVVSIKGIYVIKGYENVAPENGSPPNCDVSGGNEKDYRIAYVRLKLDSMKRLGWEEKETREGCINVAESEVIRGWRTALNAMEMGQAWQVVIPPELGYGSAGLNSPDGDNVLVDPDVNLRFMLQVVSKP